MTAGADLPRSSSPAALRAGKLEFLVLSCVIFLCTLHLLRNVSFVFPLMYVTGASLLFAYGLRRMKVTGAQLLILACYAYVVLVTLFYAQDFGDPGIGIARLVYLLPLVLYLFGARLDDWQAIRVWKLLGFFAVLAALSIFFQYVFGAVTWFAESSERAGTTRFASLAGSLTAFGSIVGPACFLAWLLIPRPLLRIALVLMFLIAALLSLQKAAILGAVLGVLLGVLAARQRSTPIASASVGVATLVLGAMVWHVLQAWLTPELQDALQVFVRGTIGEEGSGDVSIAESIRERFVDRPLASVEFHGIQALLFGVGAYGASGALGYAQLPMMHNLLGEVLIVSGVGVFSIFAVTSMLALLRAARWILLQNDGATRARAAAGVFLLTFAVGLNTGSLHFHPVIGLLFWFSLRELTVEPSRWNALRRTAGSV